MTRVFHLGRGLAAGLVAAVVIVAGAGLSSCDRIPDDARLMSDLSAYVDAGYAPGLIEITGAKRLDHQFVPDISRDQRAVSFTADLRLKRDYDFGAWEQPNAAALTYLFGASPASLTGLKTGGNKVGDVLQVTGAVSYTRSDGQWRLNGGVPVRSAARTPSSRRVAALKQWWSITLFTARRLTSAPDMPAEDLEVAIKGASARAVRQAGKASVASGPEGGEHWMVMQAVEHTEAPRAVNIATSGSAENLRLLRQNSVTAALLRSDEAALASAGEGPFGHAGTFPDLLALASLFPEQIHVVVMAASPIASVAELYGKRVAVVSDTPAALLEAGDVLRAHRVPLSALAAAPTEIAAAAALDALARGEQDAVIITAPAPAPALRNFAGGRAVRFLPLDADAVALMTTGTSSYVAVTVPAQTYPGQNKPIATVGVTALLVSTAGIPKGEVETLLQTIFGQTDFVGQGSAMGAMVKVSAARRGITLPLHPGAEAFFSPPDGGR
jgi:TRAP transporter TAXI family solute receptor